MNQEATRLPIPVTEPRKPEAVTSAASSIYEHFLGLQQLRSWMRQN